MPKPALQRHRTFPTTRILPVQLDREIDEYLRKRSFDERVSQSEIVRAAIRQSMTSA